MFNNLDVKACVKVYFSSSLTRDCENELESNDSCKSQGRATEATYSLFNVTLYFAFTLRECREEIQN